MIGLPHDASNPACRTDLRFLSDETPILPFTHIHTRTHKHGHPYCNYPLPHSWCPYRSCPQNGLVNLRGSPPHGGASLNPYTVTIKGVCIFEIVHLLCNRHNIVWYIILFQPWDKIIAEHHVASICADPDDCGSSFLVSLRPTEMYEYEQRQEIPFHPTAPHPPRSILIIVYLCYRHQKAGCIAVPNYLPRRPGSFLRWCRCSQLTDYCTRGSWFIEDD